jgi:hypothetical protein
MTEKTYTLRGLTAEDVFPMLKIISGIGLKEFKGCLESEELRTAIRGMTAEKEDGAEGAEIDTTALGLMVAVDVASVIIANVPKCKDDIYRLLSGLSGMSKKEIAALPMNVFLSMIVDVVKKEEFKDFFGDVAGLFR